jgi:hypothetical protein
MKGEPIMKSLAKFILPFSLLAAWSCDSSGSESLGLEIAVTSPSLAEYPDIKPFQDCDYVTVCTLVGSKKSCKTVEQADKLASLSGLPFGKDAAVSMECKAAVNNGGTFEPGPTVSSGQTCASSLSSGDEVLQKTLFLLPVASCGPTVDTFGATSVPKEPRWGTVAMVVEAVDDLQAVAPDRVMLFGGADFKSGCNAWTTSDCIEAPSKKVDVYDPNNGTFDYLGEGSAQRLAEARAFAAGVTLPDGRIAIFGGIGQNGESLSSVEIFDPITGIIAMGPKMEKTRAFHTATLVDRSNGGYVLLVGGKGTGMRNWEIWGPNDGMIGLANMNAGRYRHTATLIKGVSGARDMVVLAGGEDGQKVLDNYEVFDLEQATPKMEDRTYPLCTNDIGALAALPKTMHTAVFVPDHGLLYFAGGFDNINHTNPTNSICALTVSDRSFNLNAQKKLKLGLTRAAFTATHLADDVVLFAGGVTRNNGGTLTNSNTFEVMFEYLLETVDPDTGKVKQQLTVDLSDPAPMMEGRLDHSAVKTCDGRALIVGGIQYVGVQLGALETSELFNPQP